MFRVFLFIFISYKPNNGTFRATYPDGSLVSITNPERHLVIFFKFVWILCLGYKMEKLKHLLTNLKSNFDKGRNGE